MTMMRLTLLLFALSLALGTAESGTSLSNVLNKAYMSSFDSLSHKNKRDLLSTTRHRALQQIPVPPTRECGQDLGVTPKEAISQLIGALTQNLGNVTLYQTINYDVQALVVCGSCQTVSTPDLSADTDMLGFGHYCAEGRYGYNVTQSGLLFLPIDSDTGEIIANKKLKASIFAHSLTTDTSLAPSEIMPEDLAGFSQAASNPAVAFGSLYNIMGGIISASTGVVSLVPDYVGFGQSQEMTKSLSAKLYRQATIPLWLTAKSIVSNTTQGCTEIDDIATVGGYSEGGYASFAISLALNQMGVTILSCNSGAGGWDLSGWLQYQIEDFDSGNVELGVAAIMAYVGVVTSSTDPDLANSDVGQDLLLDEWMDPTNFSRNAEAWISTNFSFEDYLPSIPLPNYMEMVNPNITEMYRNAIAMNVSDGCSLAVEGETDKFCEVVVENDLSDDVANPPFPVVVCHSPEDEIIPYTLYPNVSTSENLTEFNLFGLTASGSHAEAALFCFFPMVLPFTILNTGPSAIEQVPLDTCTASPPTDGTPTTPPPPTEAPPTEAPPTLTSSAYHAFMSVTTVMASFAIMWITS